MSLNNSCNTPLCIFQVKTSLTEVPKDALHSTAVTGVRKPWASAGHTTRRWHALRSTTTIWYFWSRAGYGRTSGRTSGETTTINRHPPRTNWSSDRWNRRWPADYWPSWSSDWNRWRPAAHWPSWPCDRYPRETTGNDRCPTWTGTTWNRWPR